MTFLEMLEEMHKKNTAMKDKGYGNLKGLENTIKGSTDTAKNMAEGGTVDDKTMLEKIADYLSKNDAPVAHHANETGNAFDNIDTMVKGPDVSSGTHTNMAQGGMAQPPDLGQLLSTMNQTPPTNYDFYKDIGAEDRAKLAQHLMQQKASPSGMVASGLAGLGDAISNSYGGKNTSFQKDLGARNDQADAAQLGAFDTHRAQRAQDAQGNQDAMLMDPNSPISQSMRQAAMSAGLQVPSGMPASILMKVIPGFGDLAIKQSTAMTQQGQAAESVRHNKAMEGLSGAGQEQDAQEKEATRKADAVKTLSHRGPLQRIQDSVPFLRSPETDELKKQAGITTSEPNMANAFEDQDKERRYQEWKAKQGR